VTVVSADIDQFEVAYSIFLYFAT